VLHAARWEMQDLKNRQKFAIWTPSHNFVGLYLRNYSCEDIADLRSAGQRSRLALAHILGIIGIANSVVICSI